MMRSEKFYDTVICREEKVGCQKSEMRFQLRSQNKIY